MAWHCTGRTQDELIDNLIKADILKPGRIAEAMRATDRRHYVPDVSTAYQDSPQSIGYGATISAPHMHAYALNSLEQYLGVGSRVLDVGCGSGYLTAVMHRLVGPTGSVSGIDHLPDLTALAQRNLEKDGVDSFTIEEEGQGRGVEVVCADGRLGYLPLAPYDAIHVGAAAPSIPTALLGQLRSPGRAFIPIGPEGGGQVIKVVTKDQKGKVTVQDLMDVRYVPLTDAGMQWMG